MLPIHDYKRLFSAFSIVVFTLFLFENQAEAQNFLTREEALNLAIKENPEVIYSSQKVDQQVLLRGSSFNIPDLQLLFQSTTGTSQRVSVFQTFAYPGVYTAQVRTQKEKVKLAESEKKITLNTLIYKVKSAYNETQFQTERVALLKRKDSVYYATIAINEVRYRVGQITNLEKINGEAKYKEISYTLQQAKASLLDARIQLALLMGKPNDTTFYTKEVLKKVDAGNVSLTTIDSSVYKNNPLIGYTFRLEQVNRSMLRTERRKQYPGIMLGYLNQGPTSSTGLFYRMQFGVTLPIWFWSYQSNIRSARKGVEMAKTQQVISSNQLGTEYSRALAQFSQQKENLQYFETIGRKQSEEIIKSSRESYRLGSIGYYAFLQNIELAFQIEQNYLESLKNYNQSILILEYLVGSN